MRKGLRYVETRYGASHGELDYEPKLGPLAMDFTMLRKKFSLQGSESSGGASTSKILGGEVLAATELPALEDGRVVEDRLVLPQLEDDGTLDKEAEGLGVVMTRDTPERAVHPGSTMKETPMKGFQRQSDGPLNPTPEHFSMATPDLSQEGMEQGGLERHGLVVVGAMWSGGPMGNPASLGPVLDPERVRVMEELQRRAPMIYTQRSQSQILDLMRPEFLRSEEVRRQDETNQKMEELEKENLALRRMMDGLNQVMSENQEMKRMMNEMMSNGRIGQRPDSDLRKVEERKSGNAQNERIENEVYYSTPENRSEKEGQFSPPRIQPVHLPTRKDPSQEFAEGSGTVQVMLALMQGMQEIQKKLVDKEERGEEFGSHAGIEFVRGQHELPKLPEWSAGTAPIDLNDWLVLIEPIMADLTASSQEWCERLVSEARSWYDLHVQKIPLERLTHHPTPSGDLTLRKWVRLEKRAATMLLMGIPESQREELIATKQISAMGIICRLFNIYQPGGLAEKEVILRALESPPEANNLTEAVSGIRKWMRWRSRAKELGVSEPDASILLRGLGKIIRKPLEAHRELNFRINLTRSMLQVDSTPNSTNVHQFATHLLAEMELIAHAEGGRKTQLREAPKNTELRMKKFEKEGEERAGRKDQTKDQLPCRFFGTDAGCRKGKECKWLHQVEDNKRRCWTCGAIDHFSQSCPRAKDGKAQEQRKGGAKGESKGVQRMEVDSPPKSGGGEIPQKDLEAGSQSEESGEVMRGLLEEANRMLKNLNDNKSEKSEEAEDREGRLRRLQRQLDDLRSLQVFRIASIGESGGHGLLDSQELRMHLEVGSLERR